MQGAPKKTSGRSPSWSAPLRATSSGTRISTWRAVCNLLKIQARPASYFVGIALSRERFTSGVGREALKGPKGCGKNKTAEFPRHLLGKGKALMGWRKVERGLRPRDCNHVRGKAGWRQCSQPTAIPLSLLRSFSRRSKTRALSSDGEALGTSPLRVPPIFQSLTGSS
jgi:hypothetical protein